MLLLESVDSVSAQGGTGWVRLDPRAWHADATGRTPAWFGLEFMAQTIAACRGQYLLQTGGVPQGGYLVGTRRYRCASPAFEPSALLEVKVRLCEEDPSGLCAFQCEILHLGQSVAEATLKVMIH
jgi:predicted hotdog family 3-hydroxylacyl-ACP dehydratase